MDCSQSVGKDRGRPEDGVYAWIERKGLKTDEKDFHPNILTFTFPVRSDTGSLSEFHDDGQMDVRIESYTTKSEPHATSEHAASLPGSAA